MTMRMTLRRSRLAAELRRLHGDSGLSLDQVEERTDIKKSTLSRIHKNATTNVPYVKTLAEAYGADERTRACLIALVKGARQRGGWWAAHADSVTDDLLEFVSFEAIAATVYDWENAVLPGLLQTRAYAEAAIREVNEEELTDDVVATRAEMRLRRQDRLAGDNPLSLYAIIDEPVLYRRTGGAEVMREQLAHLTKLSKQPNVHLHVVSRTLGAHAGMLGSYQLLEFPDEEYMDPVVYMETIGGEMYLEGKEPLAKVRRLWDHLRGAALDKEASRQAIRQAAEKMTDDGHSHGR